MTLKTDVEHSLDTFLDYFYSVSQNNALVFDNLRYAIRLN